MSRKALLSLIAIALVLVLDQILKIWVKTSFVYGESRPVIGDWFQLHFIENNGFAFGTTIGGKYGKLGLTLFRMLAVGVIGYYLSTLFKEKNKYRPGYILMISLILAGAIGNIVDSVFYGQLFTESFRHGPVSVMFPDEGGYAPFLHGRVVDMLYFPIIEGTWPDWMPFIGGNYFEFFRPVFNIADSAITTGVLSILVFFRRELKTFR